MKTPTLVTPRPDHIDTMKGLDDYMLPIPVTTEPLADYALVVTASQETSRGVYWTGDLYHKGVKVACVENMGDGGGDRITEPDTGRWISDKWLAGFRSDVNAAFGKPDGEAWEDTGICFLDIVSQLG